jgi:hypothetical protein
MLYGRLNDVLLDACWILPIVQSPPHLAAGANVNGLRYDARDGLAVAEVWIA